MSLVALRVLTPENQLKGIFLSDIDASNTEILGKKVLKVDNCQRCRVFLFFLYTYVFVIWSSNACHKVKD